LKGKDGQDGIDGKDAYQIWKELVPNGIKDSQGKDWPKDKTGIQDFWEFLTGAKGQDGSPPTIGNNGNWFIDGNDTGIPARGQNGNNGKDGSVVTIGDNGNWFIDDIDTGVKAFGEDGKSAYELWKKEVGKGIEDPHNPGQLWPNTKTEPEDFWEYLRGRDGTCDCETEQQPGDESTPIEPNVPNVILLYANTERTEYINSINGSVSYAVRDDKGILSPGAEVSDLPGMPINNKYIADDKGYITVPKEDLPVNESAINRTGSAKVNGEVSAPTTYLPNRVHVRIRLKESPTLDNFSYMIFPSLVVERDTVGKGIWEPIPSDLSNITDRSIIAYKRGFAGKRKCNK